MTVGVIAKVVNFTYWNFMSFIELQYTTLEDTEMSESNWFEIILINLIWLYLLTKGYQTY